MVSVKHKFSSTKADSADDATVKPSNWNAEHEFTASTGGIVLGRLAEDGPGPIEELAITAFLPAGIVMAWAGIALPPGGWYFCDGTVRPIGNDPVLYSVIGNTFGGVASLTFATPDLRGRVIAGPDGGADRLTAPWMTPSGNTRGASGGAQSGVLDIKQVPSHTHVATITDPEHSHDLPDPAKYAVRQNIGGSSTGTAVWFDTGNEQTTMSEPTGITIAIANTGGDPDAIPADTTAPVSNLQPTLVLHYVIKR